MKKCIIILISILNFSQNQDAPVIKQFTRFNACHAAPPGKVHPKTFYKLASGAIKLSFFYAYAYAFAYAYAGLCR